MTQRTKEYRMYRKRHLGVEEGNAIDDIMAYEKRKASREDTRDDYMAYCRACQLLGIQRPGSAPIHPAFRGKAEVQVVSNNSGQAPLFSYMFGPILPSQAYTAMARVMIVFLAWAAGCLLIGGSIYFLYQLMGSILQGFAYIAYP